MIIKTNQTMGNFLAANGTESQQCVNLLKLCGYKCILPYSSFPKVDQSLWFLVNLDKKEFIMARDTPQANRSNAVWLRIVRDQWNQGEEWFCDSVKDFYKVLNLQFN